MNALIALTAELIDLNKDAKRRQAHTRPDWIYNAPPERSNVCLSSSADLSFLSLLGAGVQEDHERGEVCG